MITDLRWPSCLFHYPRGRSCCVDPGTPRHATQRLPPTARCAALVAALALLVLAGCASAPSLERDGPEAHPPAGLAKVPDAEPRIEAIRSGGPNKPYEALGREYVPITDDRPFVERGLASWYGRKFQGRRTASGELYNMYEMTAAHPTLPIPSYARVRNPANDREVVVRINDRGPFHPGRIVDLSYTAALKLDLLRGVAPVELERITADEIRTGAWRRADPGTLVATASAQAVSAAPAPASRVEPPPAAASVELPAAPVDPPRAEDAAPTPSAAAASAETDSRATAPQPRGYWVQIGAFRERGRAEAFQRRIATELDWLAPLLAIFNEATLYRLQAGPYASREEAGGVSQRIRQAGQAAPVIVERR
jgi:rare lipoprotein A